MYPISDLTAFCRRTTGDVPPKLVGASTTVVGSKMYLYGGRLVAERRMVSDVYMFDLETFNWERLTQFPEDGIPQARYFHSADTWNNYLIIFGGMAIQPQSDNPEDLCVLNDVRLFDLATHHWLPPHGGEPDHSPRSLIPKARYAHLSSVTAGRLFIIGGQDLDNVWLDDVHVYELTSKKWVQRRDYPRHCGTYRSVAVTADKRVRLPQDEARTPQSSKLGPSGTRFNLDKAAPAKQDVTSSDALVYLPYSASPTEEYPCDIFLFSNYNFTDVQRELEVFSPLPGSDFSISDRSSSMTGTSFPPGLRFPTGAILGSHFIIAGTYLSQTYQSFSIWALDLVTMTWSRIDPGSALASGSWFRSCLWPEANKFLIFGNRHGNLVEDYNRRLLSWDHVACIDLEAFGIYQPPPLALDIPMQELGLAALEEGINADFEIHCDDGRKVSCSRKLLEDRWPWFKEQRKIFLQAAARAIESLPPSTDNILLPDVRAASDTQEPRPDPRLTPRALQLSEPYPITLALVQYFYSMALITPLQHAPAVLSQLLLLSSAYNLAHLQSLVKHAMHRALTYGTSVGIYGVSTLCSCRSLQIRALRVVMAYSQRKPTGGRSRADKDGSGGNREHPNGGNSNGPHAGGGGSSEAAFAARPRGMSDASYMRGPSENSSSGSGRGYSNGPVDHTMSSPESSTKTRQRVTSESSYLHHKPTASGDSSYMLDELALTPVASPVSAPTQSFPRSLLSSPPPLSLPPHSSRRHQQSLSIVSESTEDDLVEIAEMMSSSFGNIIPPSEHSGGRNTPTPEKRRSDTDSFVPSLLDSPELIAADAPWSRSGSRGPRSTWASSVDYSAASSSHANSSHTDSDVDQLSDDFCETAYLSPSRPRYPVFHLPRPSQQRSSDSDTPSLTSSASCSSLSTTLSLSRASSFQRQYGTPPLSPSTSSYGHPRVDSPKGLHAIVERRSTEDHEPAPRIIPLNGTIRGDDSFMPSNLDLSPPPSPPPARMLKRPVQPPRNIPSLEGLRIQPSIEKIKAENVSPDTIVPDSPSSIMFSQIADNMPSPRSGGGLSRFFSRTDKKHPKAEGFSATPDHSTSVLDLKMSKAEEKKRNKQLAKARTEQLALELKEKARKRAAGHDTRSDSSGSLGAMKKPVWEEQTGTIGGIGLGGL